MDYKTVISVFKLQGDRIEITINHNASFELDVVKEHFKQVYEVIKLPKSKTILDFRNTEFASIPKESMEYMAKNEYTCDNTSIAIIVNGLSQKILSNFYLRIMRPKRKTRLFNKIEPAIAWLDTVHL
ncbi:MAG: hypothetical protein IPM77_01815 [Crocinitomicaceae bacterium]|nr:hypothetical protein [Crocinitomicaceae bacterium]